MISFGKLTAYSKTLLGIAHGSRAFNGPLQVSLSLTNRCNIRCIHCYFYSPFLERPALPDVRSARMKGEALPSRDSLRQVQTHDADIGSYRRVVDELLRIGTQRYQFSGYGEVFLHENAIELMGRIKRAGRYGDVNTNGTRLNRELLDELLRISFDELRITVMAGTDEMYRQTHPIAPEDTFSRLKDNLLYLYERKRALGVTRPRVVLVMVVVSQNAEGITDFARFASNVHADRIFFRPVDDVEAPGLKNVVPSPENSRQILLQMPEARAILDEHGVNHNIDFFLQAFNRQLDTKEIYQKIPCYYGWLSTILNTEGDAYPCCRCYDSMGNVYEQDFTSIWNGGKYRDFRRQASALNKRHTPVNGCDCFSCVHYAANLRVYKYLHPFDKGAKRMENPDGGDSLN